MGTLTFAHLTQNPAIQRGVRQSLLLAGLWGLALGLLGTMPWWWAMGKALPVSLGDPYRADTLAEAQRRANRGAGSPTFIRPSPTAFYLSARAHEALGQADAARHAYRLMLRASGESPLSRWVFAVLRRHADIALAREAYTRNETTFWPSLRPRLADVWLDASAGALQRALRAVSAHPERGETHLQLARAALMRQDPLTATHALSRCIRLSRDPMLAREAEALQREIAIGMPSHPALQHTWRLALALAHRQQASGHTAQARHLYHAAVQGAPRSAWTRLKLAQASLQSGLWAQALAHTQRALRDDPASFNAHALAGDLWLSDGRYSQAVAAYQQALATARAFEDTALAPAVGNVWIQLAYAYESQGRRAEALRAYHTVITRQSEAGDHLYARNAIARLSR